MPSAPFYLDWTFWGFVVAAIAVVLSQLPPLKQFFARSRLDLDLYGQMVVRHTLGYPNLQAVIGLRNTGGKAVRVASISATVTCAGRVVATLDGLQVWPELNARASVIFTPFESSPNSEWIHLVDFFEKLSQPENKALLKLRADVRATLSHKINEKKALGSPDNALVQVGPDLDGEMQRVFEKQFIWNPGEYEVTFCANADRGGRVQRTYRFTLYESDSTQLREERMEYKYGYGVAIDGPAARGVPVQTAFVNPA